MKKWAIYYDNGQCLTNEDCAWKDAPTDGVIFVLEKQGDRVIAHSGNDHYVMLEDNTIAATGDLGPLLRKLGFIKFGRWCSHKTYEAISKRVSEDGKSWQ